VLVTTSNDWSARSSSCAAPTANEQFAGARRRA